LAASGRSRTTRKWLKRLRGRRLFDSERLTGALLDSLTHHVRILEINGDSCRLKSQHRISLDQRPPQAHQVDYRDPSLRISLATNVTVQATSTLRKN